MKLEDMKPQKKKIDEKPYTIITDKDGKKSLKIIRDEPKVADPETNPETETGEIAEGSEVETKQLRKKSKKKRK